MQSAQDLAPPTAPVSPAVQSPGRRLLSRFASGLASKPRSVVDFYIKLDDDGRHYSTADTVKGSVRLRVLKPIRITHIVVSLSGRAHVYKNPTAPAEFSQKSGSHSTSIKGKSAGQYHGNGLATLFEEEAVLCGDGRLADGSYQFNFELEFPARDLPSSVDFERGKISYAITASLTRPTTISPVLSCEREVYYTERIDIAPLLAPKSRTIIHDPLFKRSKAKGKLVDPNDRKSVKPRSLSGESQQPGETAFRPSVSSQENDRALSPVPSEVSFESHVSSTGVPSQNGSAAASTSPNASFVSRPTHSKSGHGHKTINTLIESCSGGCLRGDQLTVKVLVHHTKYMKSMNGVIVTLYRHARVDTQPALPIGPIEKGKNDSKQSYYVKSVTGLGGLSLSGAGSAHIFRKDLAQTTMPLVVNPTSLVADVTAKLRVPEEAFPTIAGVPGAMISFKYYIEVIVDIQGKLSTPINPLRELTSTNMTPADSYETDYSNAAAHPTRILDTTYVRKDKTVVCSVFEIIIGTVDSERRKGKQKVVATEVPREEPVVSLPSHPPAFDSVQPLNTPNGYIPARYPSNAPTDYVSYTDTHDHVTAYAAPPIPDESQLSEKERLRLAEARLLPSQPPGLEGDAEGIIPGATAPQLDDEYDDTYEDLAPQDEYSASSSSRAPDGSQLGYWPTADGVSTTGVSHDERQQHQQQPSAIAQAAALGPGPADGELEHGSSHTERAAGTLEGNELSSMHDSHAEAPASTDLPRYER
ncbi:hypothetical protein AMS68_005781 [Peltaster fructicola]|uniref:Arrestin-like N-terminal domain-containing protein n=1 Tax=Peltaster fructicola TaxID=286661 RepID=A0A6H0XZU3_9PEZI|nr:hypothetical protein AMS68_005781 [Peltaster fructicola]